VFDDGEIIESGAFEELVRRGGKFATLAAAQLLTPEAAHPASIEAALPTG
jgi:ATP-binding cassette, subfamily B, beta-glucan exporter